MRNQPITRPVSQRAALCFRAVALLLTLLLVAIPAGAEVLLDYRQKVMESAHRHLKAVGYILVDGVEMRDHLPVHTRALEDFSQVLPELFPARSRHMKSDALDEIWRSPTAFLEQARNHQQRQQALATAVSQQRWKAAQDAYYQVLKACKGCHRKFKRES